ncbi:MAG TPA: hypothetical protein VLW53_24035 [Candidatus Eisenbacteria bacterium]|nr:hypothetical protein [Candidatus Eisenbacteria bacterium]
MSLAVAVVLAVLAAALLELLKDELRGQIERIPYALLALARQLVPPELRETLHGQEWLPELDHILTESDRLPITCLVQGTRYALGLVLAARTIAAELDGVRAAAPYGSPDRGSRVPIKLAVGAVAAAVSLLSAFGVFGVFAGLVVSLAGGLVVVCIVYAVCKELGESWHERIPWA